MIFWHSSSPTGPNKGICTVHNLRQAAREVGAVKIWQMLQRQFICGAEARHCYRGQSNAQLNLHLAQHVCGNSSMACTNLACKCPQCSHMQQHFCTACQVSGCCTCPVKSKTENGMKCHLDGNVRRPCMAWDDNSKLVDTAASRDGGSLCAR